MPNEQDSSANPNLPADGSSDAATARTNSVPVKNSSTESTAASSEVEPSTSSLGGGSASRNYATAGSVAVAEPNRPTVNSSSSNPTTGLSMASKKSNKRLIVGGVIVGVLALLVAGSAAAYNLWYQNPDKVIGDALGNALTATSATTDSTVSVKANDGESTSNYDLKIATRNDQKNLKADVSFTSKTGDATYEVNGSLISKDNEKLYVKIDQLKKLLEETGLQALIGDTPSATSLITKLDGSWVVIDTNELEETAGVKDDSSKCIEDSLNKLRTDEGYSKDVRSLYEKYPLVGVKNKLGSKNGSLGYEIEFKRDNAIKFVNGVNSTKFFADVQKCDDSIEKLDGEDMFKQDDSQSDAKTKVVVWIDRWSHQFTKLEVTGSSKKSNGTLTTNMKFNVPVTVEAPKDPITLDELKSDIEAIQQEMMQAAEAGTMEVPTMETSALRTGSSFEI